jgi:hypothetical protein
MTSEDEMLFDNFIKAVGPVDEAMAQLQWRRIIEMVFDGGLKREAIDAEMEEQAMKLRIYNLEWREKE